WWIGDEEGTRFPFSGDDALYCEEADQQEAPDRMCSKIYDLLNQSVDVTEGFILNCCDGYLQGAAGCWYRNTLLGAIGICHVKKNQRALLEQILRIVQGYLSLLAGALEDHDDLELVHSVWSQTITIVKMEELLPRLMVELCTAIGVPSGVIFLIDEDGDFYPAFVSGYPQEIMKRRTLELSTYEYSRSLEPEAEAAHALPEDDPLRGWLESELLRLNHPVVCGERTCLGAPFYRNQNLIGVFVSLTNLIRPFSETKQSLIRLLATSGAAALDNAQTLQRMEKRRKALATIHVIHRLICSSITTKELLPQIGSLTRQLFKVRKCSIMLFNTEKQQLEPVVTLGLERDEVGQHPLKSGEGLPGWVAENLSPIMYHPCGDPPPWKFAGEAYPSKSYLSVALYDSDIEGVITIAEKDDYFNPGDRDILITFAEQVIIAIKNARLHEGERTITVNALKSIANLIETRDPERPGVTVRTCYWAQRIARVLNLSHWDFQNITYAALLHDIGLLRTYDSEFSYDELRMKGPQTSLRFVQSLGLPKEVGDMVYHVNEAWNGR
ncbi:MAG: GAF domain-containing protein, partial [Candidatus Hinthialibacter sp.]